MYLNDEQRAWVMLCGIRTPVALMDIGSIVYLTHDQRMVQLRVVKHNKHERGFVIVSVEATEVPGHCVIIPGFIEAYVLPASQPKLPNELQTVSR